MKTRIYATPAVKGLRNNLASLTQMTALYNRHFLVRNKNSFNLLLALYLISV